MRAERTRNRIPIHVVSGILVTCFFLALPAFAQDPVVTAADPPSAEQETYDLDVEITGDNFGKDAVVDFFVTGTTNPGGITVKGKPKVLGPKKIKVTIDVEASATVDDFDIQVMSRGRTGKGIELFRVIEKVNPNQDATPPGEPLGLQVLETGYGSVKVSWLMPADDGYDFDSGPVLTCDLWRDGVYHDRGWYEPLEPVTPGQRQAALLSWLQPNTTYLLGISCRDDSNNVSSRAEVEVTTLPFVRDPSWRVDEVPAAFDDLLGHGFDPAGNVVLVGTVDLWDEKAGGRWTPVPQAIRIITGVWNAVAGAWDWSYPAVDLALRSRIDGFDSANRVQMDGSGRPAIAGSVVADAKNRLVDLVYTVFDDGIGDWTSEVVASSQYSFQGLGFAFDPQDTPTIAWCSRSGWNETGELLLARRVAPGAWDTQSVTQDCDRSNNFNREVELSFDDLGRPIIGYSGTSWAVVHWNGEAWVHEYFGHTPGPIDLLGTPKAVYDPANDALRAAGWNYFFHIFSCDRNASGGWQCENPFYGSIFGAGDFLKIGAGGDMFFSYSSETGKDASLAARAPAGSTWSQEPVDHPSNHGLALDVDQHGPFIALDPSGSPSLSWTWGVDSDTSSEQHLYFAWKLP